MQKHEKEKLMKKVISIVLALLMMIPMAAMLVPTASAADAAPVYPADKGVGGYAYYEEDFEDLDPTLVDKDLASAIGWLAPGDRNTMLIEVDGVIIVGLTEGLDAINQLKIGDIITKVDGEAVKTIYDVMDLVNEHNPGETITVEYYRGGQYGTATILLGSE